MDTAGRERTELSIVTLAFTILTLVMALPLSLAPGRRLVADVPDAHLFLWTFAWDAYAFLHQPLTIFDANIYYPYANTLAYSENLIGSAFFAAPVIWLTGNLVLASNITSFITIILSGTGAYLLGRRLHVSMAGAFLCGLVFAFAPPHFFRLGQLHMTALQWIPFCLAFLHGYLAHGRRRDLLLACGCFSLQALSSGHGAVYLALAIAMLLAWQFALGAPLAIAQRLRDLGAAGAYLLAPSVLVLVPYRLAQDDAGLRRGYQTDALPGVESFVASPTQVHQFLKARLFSGIDKEPDAYLFPGIVVLILAVTAIATLPVMRKVRLRDNATALYLLIGTLATLMFLSWPIELWRYVYWLPGFNFIRVPSRFILLTLLALAVLAALGFDRLAARLPRAWRVVAAAAIAALMLAEYAVVPFPSVPYAVTIPAVDRWLDTRPKPFVVAEMPVPRPGDLGRLERQMTQSMLHATAHWQKTIHGYSGIRRPFHHQLYADLSEFPSAASIAGLRTAGVTYVVVHTEVYGSNWRTIEEQIAKSGQFTLEHTDGDGRIYSLVSP